MSSEHQFIIAYCQDNRDTAEELLQHLQPSGINFRMVNDQDLGEYDHLSDLLLGQDLPILLLVSDNYLKSEACLDQALHALQTLIDTNQVQPIITYGVQNGQKVATKFERVSNVIQYMNYWQDMYLDMRKQKRDIEPAQEDEFNQKLKKIRGISSEIGEFLRLLRSTDYWNYELLKEGKFTAFFEKIGRPELSDNTTHAEEDPAISEPSPTPSFSATDEVLAAPEDIPQDQHKEEVLLDNVSQKINVEKNGNHIEPEQPMLEKVIDYRKEQMAKELNKDQDKLSEELVDLDKLVDEVVQEEAQFKKDGTEFSAKEEVDSLIMEETPEITLEETEEVEIPEGEMESLAEAHDSMPEEEEEEEEDHEAEDNTEETGQEDKEKSTELEETAEEKNQDEGQELELFNISEILQNSKELASSGQLEKSFDYLQTAIDKHPENSALRYQYALFVAKYNGNYELASEQLEQLLEFDRFNKNAYYLLAELAELKEDHFSSKNYYEKVITLDPDYEGVYYKLGLITSQNFPEQKKVAAKYFRKAIKQDKSNFDAHFQYALLLLENKGDAPKAIKHLKKVIKAKPDHAHAHFHLANIYKSLERNKKAYKNYKAAIKNNPNYHNLENDALFNYEAPDQVETLGLDIALHENAEVELPGQEIKVEPIEETKSYPTDKDKVVFITDALSRQGKAIAERFAQDGYRLVLAGKESELLQECQSLFEEQYQSKVLTLDLNIHNKKEVESAVRSLDGNWKKIDILINNAIHSHEFNGNGEKLLGQWESMVNSHLKGLLYISKALTPNFENAGETCHIINICSLHENELLANGHIDSAVHHAVDALTRAMRIDFVKLDIKISRISVVQPEEAKDDFYLNIAESVVFIAAQSVNLNILNMLLSPVVQQVQESDPPETID